MPSPKTVTVTLAIVNPSPRPSPPLLLCGRPQVTSGPGHSLVEAGDSILSGKRVPDKLFGLLGMHDAVAGALPPLRAALQAAQQHSRLDRASPGGWVGPPQGWGPGPGAGGWLLGSILAGLVRSCCVLRQGLLPFCA
jgi:hypothetical protein